MEAWRAISLAMIWALDWSFKISGLSWTLERNAFNPLTSASLLSGVDPSSCWWTRFKAVRGSRCHMNCPLSIPVLDKRPCSSWLSDRNPSSGLNDCERSFDGRERTIARWKQSNKLRNCILHPFQIRCLVQMASQIIDWIRVMCRRDSSKKKWGAPHDCCWF